MITIIGATGFTGEIITEVFYRDRVPMQLAGRSLSRLHKLAARMTPVPAVVEVDVTDEQALKRAMLGSSVIINCAGPFTELGLSVLKTAIQSGVHYLDITGEQSWIALAVNEFNEKARKMSVSAIPACAFEYAMADSAAAWLSKELNGLDSLEVTYMIEGMFTSRGTKRSVMKALEAKSFQLQKGELVEIKPGTIGEFTTSDGKKQRRFPFPGGEVYLVPLHTEVRNVRTYFASSAPSAVLSGLSALAPIMARLPVAKDLIDVAIEFTNPNPKRKETTFKMLCVGKRDNEERIVEISGKDPYYLTAKIATQCAIAMRDEKDIPRGVISASMVKGFEFIKSITEQDGVVWSIKSKS